VTRYRFILPLYISIPKKTKEDKRIPLTLNWYRNAQHHESAAVKRLFAPLFAETWEGQAPRIRISYHVQKMTRARYDTMNVVSVIDKFFCDWMVTNSLIKDDDFSRVEIGMAIGTNQAKKNRCLAFVEILKDDGLQITP
jgi:hypothetical protein